MLVDRLTEKVHDLRRALDGSSGCGLVILALLEKNGETRQCDLINQLPLYKPSYIRYIIEELKKLGLLKIRKLKNKNIYYRADVERLEEIVKLISQCETLIDSKIYS